MKRIVGFIGHTAKAGSPYAAGLMLGSSMAHAGTIDIGDFQTLATTLDTLFLIIGVCVVFAGLIFASYKFWAEDIGRGAMGVVGAILGGVIVGYAKTWASSLTGSVVS